MIPHICNESLQPLCELSKYCQGITECRCICFLEPLQYVVEGLETLVRTRSFEYRAAIPVIGIEVVPTISTRHLEAKAVAAHKNIERIF
jgi:hypothetical protein